MLSRKLYAYMIEDKLKGFEYLLSGFHVIEPKRDWTHFLEIGFVVAEGGFYSYYNLQYIKLDKEKKNSRKKTILCIQKAIKSVFKNEFNPYYPLLEFLTSIAVKSYHTKSDVFFIWLIWLKIIFIFEMYCK